MTMDTSLVVLSVMFVFASLIGGSNPQSTSGSITGNSELLTLATTGNVTMETNIVSTISSETNIVSTVTLETKKETNQMSGTYMASTTALETSSMHLSSLQSSIVSHVTSSPVIASAISIDTNTVTRTALENLSISLIEPTNSYSTQSALPTLQTEQASVSDSVLHLSSSTQLQTSSLTSEQVQSVVTSTSSSVLMKPTTATLPLSSSEITQQFSPNHTSQSSSNSETSSKMLSNDLSGTAPTVLAESTVLTTSMNEIYSSATHGTFSLQLQSSEATTINSLSLTPQITMMSETTQLTTVPLSSFLKSTSSYTEINIVSTDSNLATASESGYSSVSLTSNPAVIISTAELGIASSVLQTPFTSSTLMISSTTEVSSQQTTSANDVASSNIQSPDIATSTTLILSSVSASSYAELMSSSALGTSSESSLSSMLLSMSQSAHSADLTTLMSPSSAGITVRSITTLSEPLTASILSSETLTTFLIISSESLTTASISSSESTSLTTASIVTSPSLTTDIKVSSLNPTTSQNSTGSTQMSSLYMESFSYTSIDPSSVVSTTSVTTSQSVITTSEDHSSIWSSSADSSLVSVMPSQTSSTILISILSSNFNSSVSSDLGAVTTSQPLETSVSEVSSASRSVIVNPTPSLSTGSAIASSLISMLGNSSTILPTESGNSTPTSNTVSFTSGLLTTVLQTSEISSSTSGPPTLSTDLLTSTESISSTSNGSISPTSEFVSNSFFSGSSDLGSITTLATTSALLLETSTFGFTENATSSPITVQTSSMMDAVSTMIHSSVPANNSTTLSFSAQPVTTTQIPTPGTISLDNSVTLSQASESLNITPSLDSSIVSTPIFNLTSTPGGMTDSFVVHTTDGSIVTTPIINLTVAPSESIFNTGTLSSELILTTKNITSQIEVSSALLTTLPNNTESTSVILSSVLANFSIPVISEYTSVMSDFSFTVQTTVSSLPISETLASQTGFTTTDSFVNLTTVEQTTVLPTVNVSTISTIYPTESFMTGIDNASTWTNFPSTDIISLSTQIISTRNHTETIISTTPLMSSSFNASLLVVTSSVGFATNVENNTVSMVSSMFSSEPVTNHSVSVSLSDSISSVFLSTMSVPFMSEQPSVVPSLSGSLQSTVASWSSQGSDILLSTSMHEYNTSTVVIGGNQTLQLTTQLVSPTVVSNFSSVLSTSQPIASEISTELTLSSSPVTTYVEQVITSMPISTTNGSLINSVVMSSVVDSESLSTTLNLNVSMISSPLLTVSTMTAPISSMSVFSSVSELLRSTDILSTTITSVGETLSTNGLSPVLSSSVMDEPSTPFITGVSSFSTEVESSIQETTSILGSETFSLTSALTTPSILISSEGLTTGALTVILSSALRSSTQDLSTNIQSSLTAAIPDTKTTLLFSSTPVTTDIPVSSVVEASSSTQTVQLSSSVQEVASVTPSSEINPTPSSSNITSSPSSTQPILETTLSTQSMSSLASTTQIVTAAVTSLSMETSSIIPLPAATSSIPVTTVLQSSSVEVSSLVTVTSSISSVLSAVSSTVTTPNPSSSVQVTATNPSTSVSATASTVINTTPSTVTDNTTESSVTTSSSVDIETTTSMVADNTTGNSTTAAVSSSTVSTTTSMTTTTPMPTTTTPTPTIGIDVVRVFWVVTVLKVPLSVDVNNKTFISSMEQKFASAFVMAFERQKQIAEGTYDPLRRRRAAQVQDTVVNIVNATRTLGTGNVTFVYNITKNGTEVRSEEAVRTLGLLSDQEMALTLGYVVAEKASTYYGRNSASSIPEDTSNLWIVGVAVSAVVIVIIVIWVIFCFIIKKRGPESGKEGEPPHLLRMKGGNKSDESVEMVQSPSNSTHNLKKRQSYEVTKEADLEDPAYAVVKKPVKKLEDSTAGDSATLASDDTGLLPSPSKKGRRKKKKKSATEEFDNIEKESYLGSTAPPHPVREPKSMSVEDETEYQRKVAEERRKNKKRLREKRRREGQKKEDTEDMMKEYLAVQEEIDNVLEAPPQEGEVPEVFKSTSKGSKKKRRRKGDGEKNEGYEPENLTDAKKRMHKLLDDAFALITPKLDETSSEGSEDKNSLPDDRQAHPPEQSSCSVKSLSRGPSPSASPGNKSPASLFRERNKVFPEEEISAPRKNEEEQTPEKKHEPMFINPSYQGSRREGLTTWSPYRAADEVTLISMPKTVVPEDEMERKGHHAKRPAVNLPEPVPRASYTTEPPKPIILRSLTSEKSYSSKRLSDPKPYLHNGFGSREESDIDKLKSSSISQSDSGRVKSANGDLSHKPPIQHQKPFKRTPEGEDITDIVSKDIHSGETPENTIAAVRNELQNIVHPTVVTVSSGGWMGSSSGGMADIA